jgi:hypothetical protein
MSRSLVRTNPDSGLGTGVMNVALSAAGGAALGAGAAALTNKTAVGASALGGASSGMGAATLGGLIVALVSPRYRNAALATAGVGLGALIVTGITVGIVSANS